jgi:hypothetical protein
VRFGLDLVHLQSKIFSRQIFFLYFRKVNFGGKKFLCKEGYLFDLDLVLASYNDLLIYFLHPNRDLFRKRSSRRSKRRACSPLGAATCLSSGGTNPSTPVGPVTVVNESVANSSNSAQSRWVFPRDFPNKTVIYSPSSTVPESTVAQEPQRVWKSKDCWGECGREIPSRKAAKICTYFKL